MNKPYVKIYKDGELQNPINKSYMSFSPNRKSRREKLQKNRFLGNHKGHQLIVVNNCKGSAKYFKKVQAAPIFSKEDIKNKVPVWLRKVIGWKRINHFVEG